MKIGCRKGFNRVYLIIETNTKQGEAVDGTYTIIW